MPGNNGFECVDWTKMVEYLCLLSENLGSGSIVPRLGILVPFQMPLPFK